MVRIYIILVTIIVGVNGYGDNESVYSSIIYPFRQNDILFVVNQNTSKSDFETLSNLWIKLDQSKNAPFASWTTNLFLSDKHNFSLVNASYNSDFDSEVSYFF